MQGMPKGGFTMNDDFLEYLEEKYALKTQSNYIRSINFLEKNKVDLEDRSSFKQWLISQKNKGMKNITINMYMKAYNVYLDYRHEPRMKPMKSFDSVKRNRASMEDYSTLLNACRGYTAPRDRLMIQILFKAGLRYKELISLTIDDINNEKIIVQNGKNQKYREVPTFPSVYDSYVKYMKFREEIIENRNSRMLWINKYGEPMTTDGGRNAIYGIAERAGIQFSPHRARRFYARYLYDMGTQPELIQKLMGHEKLDTTLLYVQPDAVDAFSALRKNMKKLDFTASQKGRKNNLVCNQRPERVEDNILQVCFYPPLSSNFSWVLEGGICLK
jgi:integrase/recombinase XerD